MSATLIAVVLALLLGHVIPALVQIRRFGWFSDWLAFLQTRFGGRPSSVWFLLLGLGLPLALVALAQYALLDRFHGFPTFVFSVLVLMYCWGPRDLDNDVAAVEEAAEGDARIRALSQLGMDTTEIDIPASPAPAIFSEALHRWFGALFWFLLLGPSGALLYRLSVIGSQFSDAGNDSTESIQYFALLRAFLDWPVAHLMSVALAIAGSFDAVHAAWQRWHDARRHLPFDLSTGFLDAVAVTSVRHALRDQSREHDLDIAAGMEPSSTAASVEPDSLASLHMALRLVWRILITWIVVLAVFVLAGYV